MVVESQMLEQFVWSLKLDKKMNREEQCNDRQITQIKYNTAGKANLGSKLKKELALHSKGTSNQKLQYTADFLNRD